MSKTYCRFCKTTSEGAHANCPKCHKYLVPEAYRPTGTSDDMQYSTEGLVCPYCHRLHTKDEVWNVPSYKRQQVTRDYYTCMQCGKEFEFSIMAGCWDYFTEPVV